ncbi:hypothetical protein MHB84_03585 [Paenibacillus sp. FSL F4-0087]|uniref:DUF4064 domain-containing protein n=1 Tax=Paenibacillus taichungensis TaxID=484184 RepID=A0ABX2MXJ3_9BACL|nr:MULTISPECIES: hypothetical protein [Paenibacillus]MDR9744712.1 hypothetical protein [Paenibacillus taichungensis]NUU58803.1 hypothetical protein [Paenibacillus taichungensis]PIH59782.1 hypothetical protein CS562_07540 [Paenibacillus sp. LK1]
MDNQNNKTNHHPYQSSSAADYSDPNHDNLFTPYPSDLEDPSMGRLKHSGPGIASFVIGLVSIIGYMLTLGIATMAINSTIGVVTTPIQVEEIALHPAVVLASLAVLVCLILNLAGLILGVIGLILKNRKKVFAIIGTILSGVMILAFAGLIIAGIYMM